MKIPARRFLVWLSAASLLVLVLPAPPAQSVPPRDRVLILVSLDGFRWDYLQKYKAPHLSKLAAEGVHAERLIPMFPSMTFPNHHTIVTGLRPTHHGVVHNNICVLAK
jgi:predicted AlkP superfamily pyrophosphatase or phosphodiesterase